MPVVDITIGKRTFQLVCGEGQEAHLQNLAAEVSERVHMLSQSMGNTNDTLLLVMSSLMLQDEINELKANSSGKNNIEQEIDDSVADAIKTIAEYVEGVAERLENA